MKFAKTKNSKNSNKRKLIRKLEYVYYDVETGDRVDNPTKEELKDADKKDSESPVAKFFKGYSTLIEFLKPGNHLTKNGYQLLLYFLVMSNYQNLVNYSRNAITKLTGIKPSAISRAFKELVQVGFCIKVKSKSYCLLNPHYSFRGTDPRPTQSWFNKVQYEQSCEEIKFGKAKQPSQKTKSNDSINNRRNKKNSTETLKFQLEKSKSKVKIINYLLTHKNQTNEIFKQIKDISEELAISQTTLSPFLKFLESEEYISRPARGHIKLLRVSDLQQLLM